MLEFFKPAKAGTMAYALMTAACLTMGAQSAYSQETVKVAVLGTAGDLPMYVGLNRGYFEEEGLELEIIPFRSGAQMVAPLGTGQIDVASGVVAAGLYNLLDRGVTFKLVADRGSIRPDRSYMRFLVRKDLAESADFNGFEDLKGLNVGTQSRGGAAESTLNQALLMGGLTYDDVQISYLGHSDLIAGLENGAIDAGFLTEPNATIALQAGNVVEYIPDETVDAGAVLGIYAFSSDLLENRPDVAESFLRVYLKSCRLVNDAYPGGYLVDGELGDEIVKAYQTYMTLKDEELLRTMIPAGCDPNGRINIEKMNESYAFFGERGNLQGAASVDDLIDTSISEKLVEEMGEYQPATQ